MSAFGFRYAHENPFSYEFSCGVCSRVTSEEDLDGMILCEGGCKRIFHTECVGLSALPDGAASKWACSRCIQRLRACHICDGLESLKWSSSLSMVKCSVPHCGKSFHATCIQTRYGGMSAGGLCPLHQCGVPGCTAPITDECYFCTLCLKAYHLKCMPEEVEVICENTCVCLDHQFVYSKKQVGGGGDLRSRLLGVELGRPDLVAKKQKIFPTTAQNLLLLQSMDEVEVQRYIASTFLAPFKVPLSVSDEHIVLSEDEEDLLAAKPKETIEDKSGLNFIRLRTNEWVCARPKQRSEDLDFASVCGCEENVCGSECTNRICMLQCDQYNCRPSFMHRKSTDQGAKKFNCGNKPFSSSKNPTPMYRIVSAAGKGVGLFVKVAEGVKAGEFILEYIGEVLTVDGWAERQRSETSGSNQSKHFYVMDLDGGNHVVDASRKGNDSRLINHSCDPNLETQKWTVNGENRIGLFAIRNIPQGEELTFNYQFETFSSKPFKCLCRTAKCTGWIGGREASTSANVVFSNTKKSTALDEILPLPMLQTLACPDIHISGTRTDGTRKKEEEIALEEISACKEKVDFFLQYIWAGSSSGEDWTGKGRLCNTLFPAPNGEEFNPAAIFGLSVTKLEACFIKERNLLVLRTLNKARRDMARRFYVWSETIPAVERILETNWISDETCTRCRRTGNLVWCKKCVRSFHQFCVPGYSATAIPFTCRRCRCLKPGELPPIRLGTLSLRSAYWKTRRSEYWNQVVFPSLIRPPGEGNKNRKKKQNYKR